MTSSTPPGYRSLVALDRQRHRAKGVAAGAARFAASLHAIYLTTPEFAAASRHYPIVFARDDANTLHPVAVVGPEPGRNLWVTADGSWRDDAYCPAWVRRYPFATSRLVQDGEEKRLIMVDEAGLGEAAPHLFDARGEPTAFWHARLRFIEEFDAAEGQTRAFVAGLEALNVFEPFDADIQPARGRRTRMTRMWRVREEALRALPDVTLAGFVRDGTLLRLHAHLMSLDNFRTLLAPSVTETPA